MPSELPSVLPEELRTGAALFGAGEWWEAHEAWETPWSRATGDDRHFIQALILLAAALHKRWHHGSVTHRNYHKAARYLDLLPAEYAGVDLARLRSEVWAALHDPALRPRLLAAHEEGVD
ncbi:hypothetical protein DEIPH_ctg022orf0006 [Deinococcus phoenicis]|uniref:DUF309 domain-containing protein n=1 Tax=Deinococcus phoenicis TaxID=1476583 RepID=A0A016QRE3_9DEIO|nr:DUF309 domain-containing protein [Deinococcus phoenicis]EYB68467.1 hypothetical protein DEIPH_ctg022orf0006 [Deinococcus phoenicis]